MDYFKVNSITQKNEMNNTEERTPFPTRPDIRPDIISLPNKDDSLAAAISSINMANDMLRENNSIIQREILKDIIPLALSIKIKTGEVDAVTIMEQELQEIVKENLPVIDGNKMTLYRFEAKLKSGEIEYYFHQMCYNKKSDYQTMIFEDIFNGIEVQFIGREGENKSRKEVSVLMEHHGE